MQIGLADIQKQGRWVNKDLAGGLGTHTDYGAGFAEGLLARIKKAAVRLPVMSLGYIASALRRAGHDVYLTNGQERPGTHLYIVYTSLVCHKEELEFVRRIRSKGIRVGLVGAFCTLMPELFEDTADFIITGEPENIIQETDLASCSGAIDAGHVQDLDTLPAPDWQAFDYKGFRYGIYLKALPVFPVLSSRGCPQGCAAYCPYPAVQGNRHRSRSPENVINELAQLVALYGAKSVVFRDPMFTHDRARTEALAEGMLDAGMALQWTCETSALGLDERLISLMARAGLRGINIGIESSDTKAMGKLGRKSPDAEQLRRIIAACRKHGVRVGAFYIIGIPSDTAQSIEQTIKFAVSLDTDYAQFTLFTPYPGTRLYDTNADIYSMDAYSPSFRHPSLSSAELIRLKALAMRSFYARPGWLMRRALSSLRGRV